MMNAIRMVWVISRHYNTDERMVPLMELIAGEIAGKVQPTLLPGQRERRYFVFGSEVIDSLCRRWYLCSPTALLVLIQA